MKIRLDYRGVCFEYERGPLPEHRFKALCLLAACGLYVGLFLGVTALCGVLGAVVAGILTVIISIVIGAAL